MLKWQAFQTPHLSSFHKQRSGQGMWGLLPFTGDHHCMQFTPDRINTSVFKPMGNWNNEGKKKLSLGPFVWCVMAGHSPRPPSQKKAPRHAQLRAINNLWLKWYGSMFTTQSVSRGTISFDLSPPGGRRLGYPSEQQGSYYPSVGLMALQSTEDRYAVDSLLVFHNTSELQANISSHGASEMFWQWACQKSLHFRVRHRLVQIGFFWFILSVI